MSIHSQLPYDQSTSHARIPAGGINLIASIDSASEAQVTASFFGSTKALHGEVAIPSAETSTHNHSNQQYSITAVTTSAGAIAERYAYSAYGEPTILDGSSSQISSSSISNRYSYTGREWDATVGLHYFRARWMSPKTGRFLGRDPIQFEAGFHLYAYLNCLRDSDPSGLLPCSSQKLTYNYESTETPKGFGSVGGALQSVLGLVNSPALQGVMPCKLKLVASVSTENYSCPSCCGDGGGGTNGFFKLNSTGGVKVSCNSNGGVGVYVNVSGGIEVEVGLERKWDTCVPKDETNACLKLKGSMSISLCAGIAAIGTRACAKLTLECSGGYCINHTGGSDGWKGGCKLYVSGEACAFFQCVGGNYPPIIEFP